jgi:cyclin-dependent kinase regulatory subunit CKS1
MSVSEIYYSDKYYDDIYEYRHVILPKEVSRKDPRNHLLSEDEWRALGIQMSVGWIHYHRHHPEPNVLLFRREHHGSVPADAAR